MKINGMKSQHINLNQKISKNKAMELPKEQVTIGGNSGDLGIMERPLGTLKSEEDKPGTGRIATAFVMGTVTSGAVGAAICTIGGIASPATGAIVGTAIGALGSLGGIMIADKYHNG